MHTSSKDYTCDTTIALSLPSFTSFYVTTVFLYISSSNFFLDQPLSSLSLYLQGYFWWNCSDSCSNRFYFSHFTSFQKLHLLDGLFCSTYLRRLLSHFSICSSFRQLVLVIFHHIYTCVACRRIFLFFPLFQTSSFHLLRAEYSKRRIFKGFLEYYIDVLASKDTLFFAANACFLFFISARH